MKMPFNNIAERSFKRLYETSWQYFIRDVFTQQEIEIINNKLFITHKIPRKLFSKYKKDLLFRSDLSKDTNNKFQAVILEVYRLEMLQHFLFTKQLLINNIKKYLKKYRYETNK